MLTCIIVLSKIIAISKNKDLKSTTNQVEQARKSISALYLKTICNS